MKLSDAKKILSGSVLFNVDDFDYVTMWWKDSPSSCWPLKLTQKDIQFMLRQLALKVVREKEKGK